MTPTRLLATTAITLTLALSTAQAADLTIGSSTEPSAIDPQFSRTGNNQNIALQIFDRLVQTDANMQLQPDLAVSWKNVDPLTWQVTLREGVKFHDGAPLTTGDVIFSLDRAKNVPNSPAPFSGNVASIADMKAIGPLTIEFKTKTPTPDFIEQIGFVYIVEKKVAEGASLDDFNKGKAAIGTGAYRFKEWVPGDHLTLTRNPDYWGPKQDFGAVDIRFISNDASRVAALRSGSVDLIDAVPPGDLKSLSAIKTLKLFSIPSARVMYLALDSARDKSPFITDKDGKPLDKNPLKDPRVRKAMSEMVNRQLIIDRIISGAGLAASQIVPPGVAGYAASIPAPTANPADAKKLLAAAGYPDGFGITIHTTNNSFPGDADLAQALGQMFARGGLKVNGVVAQPFNILTKNATAGAYSAFIFTLANSTPTSATGLRNLLMTVDKAEGTGAFNRVHYSNPAFDKAMREAMAEFDPQKRIDLLAKATALVFADTPIIPVYWQRADWAGKANLKFEANMTGYTSATMTSLAK